MSATMKDYKNQFPRHIKRNLFTASSKLKRLLLIAAAVVSGVVLTVLGVVTLLESGYVQASHETRDEFGHTHTQQATVTLPIELASPINQGEVK